MTSLLRGLACWRFGVGCLALGLFVLIPPAAGEPENYRVQPIAHASVPEEYLQRDHLRTVFSLRARSWPDRRPVRIFVAPDDSLAHILFCRDVLKIPPFVLRRQWDLANYTGSGLLPELVDSPDSMRAKVTSTPGAVGYVLVPDPAGPDSNSPLIRLGERQ